MGTENAKTDGRAIVEDFFAARNAGDRERLLELLADNVEWVVPVSFAGFTPGPGREAIATQLAARGAGTYDTSTWRAEVHRVIVDPERNEAVASLRINATMLDGTAYENEYCWVFTLRNGEIAHIEEHTDTLRLARTWRIVEDVPSD